MEKLLEQMFTENSFVASIAFSMLLILTMTIKKILKQSENNLERAEKREDNYVEIILNFKKALSDLVSEIKEIKLNIKNDNLLYRQDLETLKDSVDSQIVRNSEEHSRIESILFTKKGES